MERTLARAREVLKNRDFRFLLWARLVSQFGDGLFQAVLVASVVFTPEKQSTTVGFAKAVAILAVPYSVLGPFAGVFIDRWSRRRILVLTPLLRAAFALLVLPGTGAAIPFYAGGLVVLSANRFFLTTAGAVIPRLVPGLVLVVSLVVFRDRFRGGVGSFSWLVAAGGVGVGLGLLTVAPLEARLGRRLLVCLAFAVSGPPLLGAAFAIDRFTVLVVSFAVGVGFAWMKVPADTMAQEAIPDAYRGRVFALYDM